jgi:RNA polymerase sigma-70 factor (ECF subfamily)
MDDQAAVARNEAEAILNKHGVMLRGYLRHLLDSPHDVEDVFQEIWLSALKSPEMLLRGRDPGAYLRGIARHLASRQQRPQRRSTALEAVIETVWSTEEDTPQTDEAERRALRECLRQLSAEQHRILGWRYEDLLNAKEIGERLGRSSPAVRMALGRIRQALGRCMKIRLAGEVDR